MCINCKERTTEEKVMGEIEYNMKISDLDYNNKSMRQCDVLLPGHWLRWSLRIENQCQKN